MSDANLPDQNPDSTQPTPPAPASWFAGWEDFSTVPEAHAHSGSDPVAQPSSPQNPAIVPSPSAPRADVWDEWQTVDFPNTVRAETLEQQALGGDRHLTPVPNVARPIGHPIARTIPPEAAPDTWTENAADANAQPNIGELISLIQELNQCNNALLDRVSQLEEALEQTQNATLVQNASVIQAIAPDSADLHTLHSQVVALSSQLDLSQQISQRQQVLAETLTQQLAASQRRVAQLEQHCTVSQQRLDEQMQQLSQRENDCRDLRTRLQRQQRHTLQFKAALERCLDAPADLSELLNAGVEAATPQPWADAQPNLAVQSLLPKVHRIQPWSAKSGGSNVPLKLDALLTRMSAQATEPDAVDLTTDQVSAAPAAIAPEPFPLEALPVAIELPSPPHSTQDVEAIAVALPSPPPDLLNEPDVTATADPSEFEESEPFTPPPIPSVNDIIKTLIAADDPNDAEATLWQDLARLVNGSADDLPSAGVAQPNDADHRDAIEPAPASEFNRRVNAPPSQPDWQSAIAPGPLPIPPLVPTATAKRKLLAVPFESSAWSTPSTAAAIATVSAAAPDPVRTPGQPGPSPVLYPERPVKKIQSLAAVDLPSFPR